jgi:response regulator RpfG family c-di-GMP phosphodiesterase
MKSPEKKLSMEQVAQIIIIDDDPLSNFICTTAIRLYNPQIALVDFTSAEEGWNYIADKKNRPVTGIRILVLLDLNMIGVSGWEFLDRFRMLEADVQSQFRVFILSSSVDRQDRTKIESNKLVAGYIIKPLTNEQLETIIPRG